VILSVVIFFLTGNLPPKHQVTKVDKMQFFRSIGFLNFGVLVIWWQRKSSPGQAVYAKGESPVSVK